MAGSIFPSFLFLASLWRTLGNPKCPPGFYDSSPHLDTTGDLACEECPLGTYGDSFGLNHRNCSGKCFAGYFGNATGKTTGHCSGPCTGGYYCPEGSTSPRSKICGGEAFYCPIGSAAPLNVSKGYYTTGGSVLVRSGEKKCEKGNYCREGVKLACPAGTYGDVEGLEDDACSGLCPPGFYSTLGSEECMKCSAGRFGNSSGLRTPECSGECSPGFYCPASAVNTHPRMFECPPGLYSPHAGMRTKECSRLCAGEDFCVQTTTCRAGFYCPAAATEELDCGGSDRYCPAGSANYTLVSEGYFTVGSATSEVNASDEAGFLNQVAQRECPPGFYCDASGIKKPCPAGTYGQGTGLTTAACSGLCEAGHYCSEQSSSQYQKLCGSNDRYCPEGSTEPILVTAGYYTTGGTTTTRTNQTLCEPGYYCDGSGRRLPCKAGFYGDQYGLSTPVCTGTCPKGFYCPEGATSSTERPCPAGTFGSRKGLEDSSCSGLCKAGFYCPSGSTSATEIRCSYNRQPYLQDDTDLTPVGGVVGSLYGSENGFYNHYPEDVVYCPEGSPEPLDVPAGHFALGQYGEKYAVLAEAQNVP